MATMIPKVSAQELKGPYVEQLVFSALCSLPDEYIVFHSVSWSKAHRRSKRTWFENDFLILHPNYGMLVLEIKGGGISYKDGLFHQINTLTHEDLIIKEGSDPYNQAKNGKYHYLHIIGEVGDGLEKNIAIEPLIWFPSCTIDNISSFPLCYREIDFAVLDERAFEEKSGIPFEKRLLQVFQGYNSQKYTALTAEEFTTITKLLASDFELVPSPSIIKEELDYAFLQLSNEQKGLLDYIEEQNYAAIQGAAGTGKTVVAVEAAKRFGGQGRKVLFLCFNSLLYEHLMKDCPCENVQYYNIHTYASLFTRNDLSDTSTRVRTICSIGAGDFRFDDVIVDEAQDMENDEIMHLKSLCLAKDGHFFVFYDQNQIVLEHESALEWIDKSECRLLLTKNCRNTYEIACTAYNVIDTVVNQKMNAIRGPQPEICFTSPDFHAELGALIRHYMDNGNGYSPHEITILSMRSEARSILSGLDNIDGIPITRDHNNTDLFFTTARRFKGLENRVVIITDIDESCFRDETKKSVFYVACSRATQRLALFISGTDEQIRAMADAIPTRAFSAKGKIIVKTKTKHWQ